MLTSNHNIIVGKVVDCDIDNDIYFKDKVELRCNIPRIYHITGDRFVVDSEIVVINKYKD